MSLEDVGSTASLGAESGVSDHCDGQSLSQGPDQDQDKQSQGQDGIVLERIASLSLDMFDPSDFTGRFTKIQSKSRKRTRIFIGNLAKHPPQLEYVLGFYPTWENVLFLFLPVQNPLSGFSVYTKTPFCCHLRT